MNSAVDTLLKKEFDQYRELQKPHPLMIEAGIQAVPFQHEKLNDWRITQRGLQYSIPATPYLVYGAVDDIWINAKGDLHIVEYKSTSKKDQILSVEDVYPGYITQMEIYTWLLEKNNLPTSPTGYIVMCNGDKSKDRFDGTLHFDITLLPCELNTDWIDTTIDSIIYTLKASCAPMYSTQPCKYCEYCEEYQRDVLTIIDREFVEV